MLYSHLIAATVMTLGVCQGHSLIAHFLYTDKCIAWSLCHTELFVSHQFSASIANAAGSPIDEAMPSTVDMLLAPTTADASDATLRLKLVGLVEFREQLDKRAALYLSRLPAANVTRKSLTSS